MMPSCTAPAVATPVRRAARGILAQAWRMTLRDASAGELRLLGLALVIAVAAVTSVGFLADRVGAALVRDAARMLGADLVLESDSPVGEALADEAARLGLAAVRTWQFPSMAGAGDRAQLAAVKAVEPGYPLRGELRTADAPGGPPRSTPDGAPAPGTAWADAQLLAMLGADVGDELTLGDAAFRVERIIAYEPDRGMQFVNVAPRLLINARDLPATGLLAPGARVEYNLLVAGRPEAVDDFRDWLASRLARGQRIETLESGRPEVRRALDRAQRFLALVALLAVMISAVAVALAARRYALRHVDGVAVMRCLGASRTWLTGLLAAEFAIVGVAASLAGSALGYAAHAALIAALGDLVGVELPAAGWTPAAQGLLTGVWLLLGFALPPLSRLLDVSPARVLRRDAAGASRRHVAGYALGAAGFGALLWWFAGDLRLGAVVAGGFLAAFAAFGAAGALALALLGRARAAVPAMPALRFALAGMVRRRGATLAQVCALAMGLMALVLLAITRTDLIAGWQRSLPANAPNRFLINIQPDQRGPVAERLAEAGLGQARLWPMIRGRLVAINDRPVSPADYADARAKRLVDRDFNLSYAEAVPRYNVIVQGRDLDPQAAEVSLEEGLARSLGIALGDHLRFDVAGRTVQVAVTSIRRVDWDSMNVNFFALMSPVALGGEQQSWLTSFYLPPQQADLPRRLVREFPNLTVFDVGAILAQLREVLDRVTAAVQLLFVFTLGAGLVVLAAALSATRDERVHEAALLRALGATRGQLVRAQRIELLAAGALAGLLAAAGAMAVAWALASYVFEIDLGRPWWPWLVSAGAGMLAAWAAGALALRGVLRTPPLVTLRQA